MQIMLTIAISVVLLVPGIIGVFRVPLLGFLALVGTFVAAAMVELWLPSWSEWIIHSFKSETPRTWIWAFTSVGFLAVAVIVGYGSSTFLSFDIIHESQKLKDRFAGFLLGLLNGALIASYLIRYTSQLLENEEFEVALQSSFMAQILQDWLRWFVLAVVLVVMLNIVRRLAEMTIFATGKKRPVGGGSIGSVAGAKTKGEQLDAISSKIQERMGDGGKK